MRALVFLCDPRYKHTTRCMQPKKEDCVQGGKIKGECIVAPCIQTNKTSAHMQTKH